MSKNVSVQDHVVLFTDIHDYWTVTDVLGGDQHEFLQTFYERLGDIIVAHQGEIIKYLGDALLCLFPPDSEEKTIQCAMELRNAYAQLLAERDIAHESDLEVGIGSGEVTIGTFGHPSLRTKDVFGEEVNRAAIIGHHRGIAITESVYQKVRQTYSTRTLPEVKTKAHREPIKVWEILP